MKKESQYKNGLPTEEEYLNILEKLPTDNQYLEDQTLKNSLPKWVQSVSSELLSRIDLDELSYELRDKANNETSKQRKTEALKRLQVVEALRKPTKIVRIDQNG
ncbi:MAG: hypothetical protein CM15mP32_0110 [Flavobacteriaceae bacterium]|nr:MAG: hypothetical protein CM15mP32_0110 [Flavobacteriaceae bacterium]